MPGPLAGMRVVDCSWGTAGPRVSWILADYGADVVRVVPLGGDPLSEQLAVPYSVYNRAKRVVELDVVSQRGELLELVARADVFIECWRPGVADRLGVGYAELHTQFPGLTYCSISGFGEAGPYRGLPGYEALVHAVVGTMGFQNGFREHPLYEGLPFASLGAAYLALIGVLASLYRREDDGTGRHVETSLYDGALAYLGVMWCDVDVGESRHDIGSVRLVCRPFRCADDEDSYIGVHTGSLGGWGRFVRLMGLEGRLGVSETGRDHGVALTPAEKLILDNEVPEIFAKKTRAEWLDLLIDADIAAAPILHPGEAFDYEQVRTNGLVTRVSDPVFGAVDQVGPSIKFGVTPAESTAGLSPVSSVVYKLTEGESAAIVDQPTALAASHPPRPLLEGVRILDFSSYHAGPYASRLLADLGADVIKLEPVRGDVERWSPSVFRNAQAGKRSIAIDLKHPKTDAVKRALIEWADVVHHNMRPGVAERLGMGYEQLRLDKADLVYLHAPGWGTSGPWKQRQSFEPLQSYFVGAGFEVAGQFNPPVMPAGFADPGAGLLSAVGILMGLLYRRRTGVGQLIENPQLNATMAHVAHIMRSADGEVLGAGRLDPAQLGIGPLKRLYQTADGWLCIEVMQDHELEALGRSIGIDLRGDERFSTNEARQVHSDELVDLLSETLAERTTAQWLELFRQHGVPSAEPVLNWREALFGDPFHRQFGRIAEVADPKYGRVREVSRLIRVNEAAVTPHQLAPGLGQHSREILVELGFGPPVIDELIEQNLLVDGTVSETEEQLVKLR